MRLVTPLVSLALLGLADPASACRCAQLPLERYWESAEIVLVGRAEAVEPRTVDGVPALAVAMEPVFNHRRPFKGSLDGLTLLTPASSARCGVAIEKGESYVVFASRQAPDAGAAWFDSCGGSRLYAGGTRAHEISPFVGLPRNRIVPRLFELAGAPPADEAAGLAENGAYRAWRGESTVYVDVERAAPLRIEMADFSGAAEVRWINEKLLFLRIFWGRVLWSDLVVDVERGVLVYEEQAVDGTIAFQQFQGQCGGDCPPCEPLPADPEEGC